MNIISSETCIQHIIIPLTDVSSSLPSIPPHPALAGFFLPPHCVSSLAAAQRTDTLAVVFAVGALGGLPSVLPRPGICGPFWVREQRWGCPFSLPADAGSVAVRAEPGISLGRDRRAASRIAGRLLYALDRAAVPAVDGGGPDRRFHPDPGESHAPFVPFERTAGV